MLGYLIGFHWLIYRVEADDELLGGGCDVSPSGHFFLSSFLLTLCPHSLTLSIVLVYLKCLNLWNHLTVVKGYNQPENGLWYAGFIQSKRKTETKNERKEGREEEAEKKRRREEERKRGREKEGCKRNPISHDSSLRPATGETDAPIGSQTGSAHTTRGAIFPPPAPGWRVVCPPPLGRPSTAKRSGRCRNDSIGQRRNVTLAAFL